MSSINIHGVPNAPGGYSLTGKKVMVHDPVAPLATSTVLVNATMFSGSGSGGLVQRMFKEEDGDLLVGSNDFQDDELIGATELFEIVVNKVNEWIDDDFTFDDVTGTITRTSQWFAEDKMIIRFKPQ